MESAKNSTASNRLFEYMKGDRVVWIVVIILSLISILGVYSSTGTLAYKYQAGNTEYYLLKHLSILGFALLMMYLAHLADYRIYSRIAQILIVVSWPLLLYTLLFGSDINEAKRWITLPVINLSFQTSDLAKLGLIMYLARYLSRKQEEIKSFRNGFLPIMISVVITCALIAPANLSTATVLFCTSMLILFIGRAAFKYIAATFGAGLLAIGILIILAFTISDVGRFGTWKNRMEGFFGNDKEVYQVEQSKIAIAEGGIVGKGPGNSTQRNFLPHPYSDFIFSIIVEEYGFVGGAFLVFLYLIFLFRTIKIVRKSPGTFGAFLSMGLSLSLVIQAFINMGVAVNLLPVTGLALPLVSMGGTSLWFTSISIGIILSVSRQAYREETKERETRMETRTMAAA